MTKCWIIQVELQGDLLKVKRAPRLVLLKLDLQGIGSGFAACILN